MEKENFISVIIVLVLISWALDYFSSIYASPKQILIKPVISESEKIYINQSQIIDSKKQFLPEPTKSIILSVPEPAESIILPVPQPIL